MISAIVPAAGRSRRMGTQKLLLPWAGTTVIGHVVDQLLRSVVDEVYVVVGCQAERIAKELCGRAVRIVPNPDHQAGMLSSVRRGLQALPRRCEAIMVALGDQPALTTELADEIVHAFAATDKAILVPVYGGRRGHPILFSTDYRHEILLRYDHVGLRGLLRAHPDDVFEWATSARAVLSDIDYPDDYERELASLEQCSRNGRAPREE